jgi:hypothetical protein
MIRLAAGADRRTRAIFWMLLVAALALPWGTGAAVKIYLDTQGLPTYPWHYFLNPWTLAIFVIPSSVYWSSPLLALALLWLFTAGPDRLLGSTRGDRLIIVLGGFLLGAAGAVRLYIPLFWDIQHSTVSAGLVPLLYLSHVLVGTALGSALAIARARRRTRAGVPL